MKKILLFIFILYQPFFVKSQEGKKIVIKELTSDLEKDSLVYYRSSGSGFGAQYINFVDGKTKTHWNINNYYSFGNIVNAIAYPDTFHSTAFKPLLHEVRKNVHADIPYRKTTEGSLSWLIDAIISPPFSNEMYENRIRFRSHWENGNLKIPTNYFILIKGDTLKKAYKFLQPNTILSHQYDSVALGDLVYYPHNHGEKFIPVQPTAYTSDVIQLYKTKHGIVSQYGGRYRWVFVTDASITGGPQKLRWKSIKEVYSLNQLIIARLSNSPSQEDIIYIIDTKKNYACKMKFAIGFEDQIKINNGGITFITHNGIVHVSKQELIDGMEYKKKTIDSQEMTGKIIKKSFVSKAGYTTDHFDWYFVSGEKEFFIKTKTPLSVNIALIKENIEKNIKIDFNRENGLMDTDNPMYQSRKGEYIIVTKIH